MPKKATKKQRDFKHTWYLQEWMAQSDPVLIQADLIHKLGWSRAKASDVYNGQRYTQALIDDLSILLNIRPYELLLHPSEAAQIKRLTASLREIARETAISQGSEPEVSTPAESPTRRQA